jgi:phage recombination protein Bet
MAVDRALVASAVDPSVSEAMEVYARLQLVRNVLAPDLNDMELQLFAMVANQSRLDPFAKQIYAIKRNTRNGPRLTFQTGIDGFRSSAEETGEYRGSDEPEYGDWIAQPFGHPEWARVVVHRRFPGGDVLDQSATVYWSEFYPGEQQGYTWKQMPRVMLAKCAEAAAMRKAFPKRFGQVYTAEEMQRSEEAPVPAVTVTTARERAEARLAAVIDASVAPATEPADAPIRGGTSSAVHAPEPARQDTSAISGAPSEPVRQQASGAVEPVSLGDQAPAPSTTAPTATDGGVQEEGGESASSPSSEPPTKQCESMSPYDKPTQCQRERGHTGTHRNRDKESWS